MIGQANKVQTECIESREGRLEIAINNWLRANPNVYIHSVSILPVTGGRTERAYIVYALEG